MENVTFLEEGTFKKFYVNEFHRLFYQEISKKSSKRDENVASSIIDVVEECFFHLKSKYQYQSKILKLINYYFKLTHDIIHEKWSNLIREEKDEIDGFKEWMEIFFLKIAKNVITFCVQLIIVEIENSFLKNNG